MEDSYQIYQVRYFLDISYRGTPFSGWQIQANAASVQQAIEAALSTILKEKIAIVGSGRTDAGVHAYHQIAHFDHYRMEDILLLQHKLNSLLDSNISINKILKVAEGAHARFDAESRTYHYLIHQHKDPFKMGLSYYYSPKLDTQLINQACEIIKAHQNFECFSKVHTEVNHFNCYIFDAAWSQRDQSHTFVVTANRFLRGMVRSMVGTLLDVGIKKTSLNRLREILNSNDRTKAGRAVPAEGLFLARVSYPESVYLN